MPVGRLVHPDGCAVYHAPMFGYRTTVALLFVLACLQLLVPATSSAKVIYLDAEDIAQVLDKAEEGNRIQVNRTALHALVPPVGQVSVVSAGIVTAVVRNHPVKGVSLIVFIADRDRRFIRPKQASTTLGRATTNAKQCAQGKYSTIAGRYGPAWPQPFEWRISTTGRPGSVTQANFVKYARRSISTWTGARNECGKADRVQLRESYRGTTRSKPDITVLRNGTWGCGKMDGVSEVGWVRAPNAPQSGLTCSVWSLSDSNGDGYQDLIESDIALNTRFGWRTTGSRCSGKSNYVSEVLTHEFGHAIGIGHAPAKPGVMYAYHNFCGRFGLKLSFLDYAAASKLY